VTLNEKKEAIRKVILPELALLQDLIKSLDSEKDDLDLWLYVDDIEAASDNLLAGFKKLCKHSWSGHGEE